MNEILENSVKWIWILLVAVILGLVLVFIVTHRRHWWLRYTTAEERFSLKIGISKKWASASRRFSESRVYIWFLWCVIIAFLVLAFFFGKLYLRAKHQLSITAPPEAVSFFDIAQKHDESKDYGGAISNLTKSIEIFPRYAAAYNLRAKAKYKLDDYQGAITDATKVIELDSSWPSAYNARGFSKFFLNDYAGAIKDFDQSIKLEPTYAPAYNQRGLAYLNLTNYSSAISDFSEAIHLNTNYDLAYFNRGKVKNYLTNYADANIDFTRAIECYSNYPAAYNMRGLTKWYLKDFRGTIADCTEAIRLDPKFAEAYNNRGLAKNELGNYREAILDLNKSLELNSNLVIAYHNRSSAKYHLGDNAGAIADLNKSITLNPDDSSAYFGLGFIQNQLFQFKDALKNFQKALQLDSSLDDCRFYIWLIRSRSEDRFGATEDLKDYLISSKHKQPTWTDVIGLYLIGKYSEKDFLNCAKSEPSKWQNWWRCRANYFIGMKRLIAGDKVGAMRSFQECLASGETSLPEYENATVELKAIEKTLRR